MKCQNCGHESDQIVTACPACGKPMKNDSKGMLLAGRVLFVIAVIAAVFTLGLFIHNTIQNQQDRIFDAIRDFRHEKLGTVSALIAFLSALAANLLILLHYRKHGKPERPDRLFFASRILVAAEGVLLILSVIIGE